MRQSVRPIRLMFAPVALALVAAVGCGGSPATLTGKVTYNGKNLKGGNVTLVPEGGGASFTGPIQEDGTYTIQARSGSYKVCVETSSLKPPASQGPMYGRQKPKNVKNQPPPGANVPEGYQMADPNAVKAENARRYVEIPDTYAKPETTPLTVDVKGGPQTHDIPLT